MYTYVVHVHHALIIVHARVHGLTKRQALSAMHSMLGVGLK